MNWGIKMEVIENVAKGYKKTKIGLLPEDWKVVNIGDVSFIDKKNLGSNTENNFSFKYVSLSDITNGKINENIKIIRFEDAPSRARRIVSASNILMATVRPNLKSFAFINTLEEPTIASTGFAVIEPNKECDGKFLFYNLFSYNIEGQIFALVVGSNYPAINSKDVRNLKIPLPPLSEQQKIAKIISTWNQAIFTCQNLIEQLQHQKKGLMQQLLTGKLRLPGFNDNWDEVRFGSFIKERNEYPYDELPLYSLTIEEGVVPKTKRYERSFLVKSKKDAYKKMIPGDFALNPMNLRFGAIARHKGDVEVCVSKYYNIFHCTDRCNKYFFEYYLTSYDMIQYYNRMAIGSLEEKKRVHFSDFKNFKKRLPSKKEQEAIAKVLISADNEIANYQRYLEQIQAQKKGLMQQLLTGKKRVKTA